MPSNRAAGLQVISPVLTTLARNYKSKGYIGDSLLPAIPVDLPAGQYPIFDDAYWFGRQTDNKVADRAPAKEVDFKWSLDSFVTEEYALKVSITDKERAIANSAAGAGIRLESSKTRFLSGQMALAREVRIAALLDTISNGGGLNNGRTSTPTNNWNVDVATIEADIKAGVLDIYDTIGMAPNTIVIPYKVAYAMAIQEDIRAILANQISGGNNQFLQLGSRVLPAVIHGMQVRIPMGAQQNTANEGAAKSISEIWGDDVRLLYVDANAEWGEPSVAYRMVYNVPGSSFAAPDTYRKEGTSGTQPTVTKWRQADPEVDYIKEHEDLDEKVVAPDAGHILRDVLS